jgi:hypothetical protein
MLAFDVSRSASCCPVHVGLLAATMFCLVSAIGLIATGCSDEEPGGSGGAAGIGGAAGSGARSFMDCVNPSPDNRCECYPFGESPFLGPSCAPTGTCALRFLTDSDGSVIGLPALDGSDGVKTSECFALEAQPHSLGERCTILTELVSADVNARRDTCAPNLFCADLGGQSPSCVRFCRIQDDCLPATCRMLTSVFGDSVGTCSGPDNSGGTGGDGGGR